MEVSRTQAVGDAENKPAEAGELVHYNDGSYEFGGDGKTTANELAAVVIDRAAKVDDALEVFVGNLDAAKMTANYAFQFNQNLDANGDAPIPVGERMTMPGSMELKNLLGPWAKKLDQLTAMVAKVGVAPTNKFGAQMSSVGLNLPLGNGGEPEPVT